MPSKQHTTVVLNESVQKIKDELSPIYGLKNILSAGLMLFDRLSDTEQKKVIAEVNALSLDDGHLPLSEMDILRGTMKMICFQNGQAIQLLKKTLKRPKLSKNDLHAVLVILQNIPNYETIRQHSQDEKLREVVKQLEIVFQAHRVPHKKSSGEEVG